MTDPRQLDAMAQQRGFRDWEDMQNAFLKRQKQMEEFDKNREEWMKKQPPAEPAKPKRARESNGALEFLFNLLRGRM